MPYFYEMDESILMLNEAQTIQCKMYGHSLMKRQQNIALNASMYMQMHY